MRTVVSLGSKMFFRLVFDLVGYDETGALFEARISALPSTAEPVEPSRAEG